MPFNIRKFMTFPVVLLGLVFAPSLFAQGYSIAPVPGWVENIQAPAWDQAQQGNNSDGVAYLLVDRQWRVNAGRQSHYRHYVSKALNTSGVESSSQISIDFDPVYESITLHEIVIHRDGQSSDRLNRSRISVIQREKDLESLIYDGSKTLNVFVDDVRSGDIVEYSYTLEGANPIFSGHFSRRLKMRWSVPVARSYHRVLWASPRPLHIRNRGTDIQPEKKRAGRYTEYVWRQDGVEELLSDGNTPGWYEPYPVIYLSDYASWNAVTDWAWPLYRPVTGTPAQNAIIAPILETTDSPEQRVLAALHFVQDEVRYLGIEMGTRSHEPNTPDAVIDQRFGDCKDKSRLLVSLLQGMGIEASSALVNTTGGEIMKDVLPTPTLFDHAIVVARVNGRNYWLDPTRTYQSGDLDAVYQPDYDYALVITEQGSDLVEMSGDVAVVHSKTVEETFDLRGAIDAPATYRILTRYGQYYADDFRQELSETSIRQMQQSYLKYMANYYSDIQVADSISVTDDKQKNSLALTEQYTIPAIWTEGNDERYIYADFEPFLIYDHVRNVESPIRTMPYAVSHPVRYQHTTRVLVPEDSSFDDEFIEVADPAFRFTKKVEYSDGVLVIDYVYESRKDHVAPEDIQAYAENIRAARGLAGYQMLRANPAIDLGQYSFDARDVNWPMAILVLLAFAGSVFVGFRYVYLYDPVYRAPDNINSRLAGISGWLLLPGLMVIFSPIRIAIDSRDLWYVFSAQQWSIVEDYLTEPQQLTVAFEMVANAAMLVAGLFLAVLFFSRRHTLPRFFIAYMLLTLAVHGGDLLLIHLLSFPDVEVARSDIVELARLAFSSALWSLYFVRSERVKATFTRRRKRREPASGRVDSEADVVVQHAG
ncbi:MAG TPA: DUF3857 domain-containing protein [Gammaproteobacteria bacterium]|nr:DUF3857 domain-containing protein [Gammaproteobacteria bacterium]